MLKKQRRGTMKPHVAWIPLAMTGAVLFATQCGGQIIVPGSSQGGGASATTSTGETSTGPTSTGQTSTGQSSSSSGDPDPCAGCVNPDPACPPGRPSGGSPCTVPGLSCNYCDQCSHMAGGVTCGWAPSVCTDGGWN